MHDTANIQKEHILHYKNVDIGSRADVTINGFESVYILLGFMTTPSCKVMICNDPYYFTTFDMQELSKSSSDDNDVKAMLYNVTSTLPDKIKILSCLSLMVR